MQRRVVGTPRGPGQHRRATGLGQPPLAVESTKNETGYIASCAGAVLSPKSGVESAEKKELCAPALRADK